ncbi:C40 family peptidase [Streptomyces sp. NPDC090077]|uniref:C40 family peptidase n=1 Tax=Streptomyces sp. NPDC090077 TaxID=3365938 RepID=UPI00382BC52B
MSHTAHIPSHRKPRRSASKLAVRAGVAGGVLSTLAMAGTASASPSEPVAETTLEMPVLDLDLGTQVSNAVNTAAENTRVAAVEAAVTGELNAQEESARTGAAAEAKQAKEDATKVAELKAKQEADRKAEAERAGRDSGRTDLTNASASDNGGSSTVKGSGSGSGSTASKPATGSAAAIIAFARAQIGKPYVLGSTGPTAYDCSGLVQAAYRQANISLDRVSQDQSMAGRSVSLNALQPGDIVYWGAKGSAYHVAIYSGNGKFIGAQNPSTGIVERSLSYDMPTGAVRVL